jgi:hypothetical protein
VTFLIFTVLAFFILRLTFRIRFRTLALLSLVTGMAADLMLDLIVMLRR